MIWRFENRWRIEAILTTQTPLHIGSGEILMRADLDPEGKQEIEVSAVAFGYPEQDGEQYPERPYLPATTLKGNLRAWLRRRDADKGLLNNVLGEDSREGASGRGGKIEFQDAVCLESPAGSRLSGWDDSRKTALEASTAIHRLTRTARENKLFHREVVPPQTCFRLILTGQNLAEDEIALLLAGLMGFNDPHDPVTLGAETGSGKGRLKLETEAKPLAVFRCGRDELLQWLRQEHPPSPPTFYQLNQQELAELLEKAARLLPSGEGRPRVELDLVIEFTGPFLVNDPPGFIPPDTPPADKPPDHRPRRDHQGRTLLPAKSVRGVLRAQAERIIRTLGGHACRVDDPQHACKPVEHSADIKHLCPACLLFGAAGWRSCLDISDFTLESEAKGSFRQEFVAIDRFTGGSAKALKFEAEAALRPTLAGRLTLDLKRSESWMPGLLALVLRDLLEGDLTFGFGAAKGYGAGRGSIRRWRAPGADRSGQIRAIAAALQIDTANLPQEGEGLIPEVKALLEHSITMFREIISRR